MDPKEDPVLEDYSSGHKITDRGSTSTRHSEGPIREASISLKRVVSEQWNTEYLCKVGT